MTTSMFGAPLGFQTYDHDQAALALQAAQTAHQRSLTGMNMAQTDTMLRKQANGDRLMAALAANESPGGQPGGQPGDPQQLGDEGGYTLNGASPLTAAPSFEELSARLRKAAGIYNRVGQAETAGKIAVEAARLKDHLSKADQQLAARQEHQITNEIKQIRLVQEALTGATSPATYDAARLMLQSNSLTADEAASLPKQYDPGAIQAFLAGSPALIKQRELALKDTKEEGRKRDDASKAALRRIQGEAAQGRLKAYEDRTDHLLKNGGKVAADKPQGPTSPGDIVSMKNLLRSRGVEVDPDMAKAMADDLAEQARIIWKYNPAIAPPAAEAMVVENAILRGNLKIVDKTMGMKFGSDTYTSTQGSVSRPIPTPSREARGTMKKGHFYQDDDGTLYQYLGGSQRKIIHGKARLPPVQGGVLAEEN